LIKRDKDQTHAEGQQEDIKQGPPLDDCGIYVIFRIQARETLQSAKSATGVFV
jgi:hypothetical protein